MLRPTWAIGSASSTPQEQDSSRMTNNVLSPTTQTWLMKALSLSPTKPVTEGSLAKFRPTVNLLAGPESLSLEDRSTWQTIKLSIRTTKHTPWSTHAKTLVRKQHPSSGSSPGRTPSIRIPLTNSTWKPPRSHQSTTSIWLCSTFKVISVITIEQMAKMRPKELISMLTLTTLDYWDENLIYFTIKTMAVVAKIILISLIISINL